MKTLSLKHREAANQAMQRTPNGACGKQCDIDGEPEGGPAGKPGIKELTHSLPLSRLRPSGFMIYVAASPRAPFGAADPESR